MNDPALERAGAFDHRRAPRIFCIGRNYVRHIAELNHGADARQCVVFMKPASALVAAGEPIILPAGRGAVHHEAEVVVELSHGGADIRAARARAHIGAVGLGLDLTLRDVQNELRSSGQPWEYAKSFDHSAPLGPLVALDDTIDLAGLGFDLHIDGVLRQRGDTARMLVGVCELVALLSRRWRLLPGDLIFTGTPAGVGPLAAGMQLELSSPQLPGSAWRTAAGQAHNPSAADRRSL